MSKKPNHYSDVAIFYDYDATNQMNLDIPFYIEYAKRIGAKNVLDLCCGTGRVAIELAKSGFNVTALDLSSAMLEVFKGKLDGLAPDIKKNVSIVHGNATSFNLNQKFDFIIIPYRSFQQFANSADAEGCLKCVNSHLASGGMFILSCYRPLKVIDDKWIYPKKMQWQIYNEETGQQVTKYHWGEKIDTTEQLIYPVLCYEVSSVYGAKEVFYEDLTLKYYYHGQLVELLHKHSFVICEEFGDYQKQAIETGTEYIFVCRKSESGEILEKQHDVL